MSAASVSARKSQRLLIAISAILGGIGVLLGALGAHALKPHLLEIGQLDAWSTAVSYQLLHAIAAFAAAISGVEGPQQRSLKRAAWCWLAGILLFAGSIYALTMGAPHWVGPFTPIGGVCLLAGWGFATASAFKPRG